MSEPVHHNAGNKNAKVGAIVAGVALGMVGMAYAAVPLYELFCQVTGYGGTTQQTAANEAGTVDRDMKVRFLASTHRDMPWQFKPAQIDQHLKIGEQSIAYYEAYNPTDQRVTGTATFNVTPHKAGMYFAKIDCFCFTEQVLEPGERVMMPVVYYVDPEMIDDRNMDNVSEIALSYTFFVVDEDETNSAVGR